MGSLKLVQIVCRHGFRTPALSTDSYLGDTDNYFLSYGMGQLTQQGRRQMFELGKHLRKRYDHFLTENPRSVKARSSELDRCMDSASCLLAGMYPPRGVFRWNADLDWQPVPVYTEPINQDKVLFNLTRVSQIRKILNETRLPEKIEQYRERIQKTVGEDLDLKRLLEVSDIVISQDNHGLKMPKHIAEIVPECHEVYQYCINFMRDYEGSDMQLGGGLLDILKTNMKDCKEQSGSLPSFLVESRSYKTHVFCTSDVIIVCLMKLLGICECIEDLKNGAIFIFELHEIQGNHLVRIYLNNGTLNSVSDFQLLELPNSSSDCPLEEFLKL